MIDKIVAGGDEMSAELLVDACLDQMGAIRVSDDTRSSLVDFAREGPLNAGSASPREQAQQRAAGVLRMVGSTREFQQT